MLFPAACRASRYHGKGMNAPPRRAPALEGNKAYMRLDTLEIGKDAIIASVDSDDAALRQHILDMGLTPGTEVTMMKYAPMGDPVEIRLRGYELTLRKDDAARIEIRGVHDAHNNPRKNAQVERTAHPSLGEEAARPRRGGKPIPEGHALSFALAGNQNCGKTTLFNQLTGSNQHVGNSRASRSTARTARSRVMPRRTRHRPARHLLAVALHKRRDRLARIHPARAARIDIRIVMHEHRAQPVPYAAAYGARSPHGARAQHDGRGGRQRRHRRRQQARRAAGHSRRPHLGREGRGHRRARRARAARGAFREHPGRLDFCAADGPDHGALHRCIHGVCHLIEDHAAAANLPLRFAATKLIEGDERVIQALSLQQNELDALEHIIRQMEEESQGDACPRLPTCASALSRRFAAPAW